MQDNYALQAAYAKKTFLTYDSQALAEKCGLSSDADFLYLTFFSEPCRLSRHSGDLCRFHQGRWIPADSHGEIMTVLDLICDSQDTRHPSGRFQNMQAFGHQFHRDLNENQANPASALFQQDPQGLALALQDLGGIPFQPGDVAYRVPVFEDLQLVLQFFLGDEEFAPRIRYLWDLNALQYLRYETMYYAAGVLMDRIRERMQP